MQIVRTRDHGHEVPDEVRDLDDERESLEVGGEGWKVVSKGCSRAGALESERWRTGFDEDQDDAVERHGGWMDGWLVVCREIGR